MRQGKRIKKTWKTIGLIALILLLLAGIGYALWRLWPLGAPVAPEPPAQEVPAEPPAEPDPVPEPPIEPTPAEPPEEPDPVPEEPLPYDYTQPVPENDPVEETWFDDAIFIGNSRTEGFALYSGLGNCRAFTRRGIMVNTVLTEPAVTLNGVKVPLIDAVAAEPNVNKIYLMLGMNELGWPEVGPFAEDYALLVDRLREIAPEAQLYIQSILPVTKERSDTDPMYNNPQIDKFNAAIKQMCADKEVYYLDVASAVADEEGFLPDGSAFDGLHLKNEGCRTWLQYLMTHTIDVTVEEQE